MQAFDCTLVATNVTSSTLAGFTAGQTGTITIIQPGGGGSTGAAVTGLTGMAAITAGNGDAASESCVVSFTATAATTGKVTGQRCDGGVPGVSIPGSTSGISKIIAPATGGGVVTLCTGACTVATTAVTGPGGFGFIFGDPAGSALSAGSTTTVYVTVPYACTITGWDINVDAGTATVKFWRKATGTAIPTSSDSINTSGVAISTGTSVHSTTTSDFTSTAVAAFDIIAANITTIATAKYLSATLECQR